GPRGVEEVDVDRAVSLGPGAGPALVAVLRGEPQAGGLAGYRVLAPPEFAGRRGAAFLLLPRPERPPPRRRPPPPVQASPSGTGRTVPVIALRGNRVRIVSCLPRFFVRFSPG